MENRPGELVKNGVQEILFIFVHFANSIHNRNLL